MPCEQYVLKEKYRREDIIKNSYTTQTNWIQSFNMSRNIKVMVSLRACPQVK